MYPNVYITFHDYFTLSVWKYVKKSNVAVLIFEICVFATGIFLIKLTIVLLFVKRT